MLDNDIEIEPTYNGVQIESTSNVCTFSINTICQCEFKSNERYVALYSNNGEPLFTISGVYCENGGEIEKTKIKYVKQSNNYEINVYGSINSSKIVFEINSYEPKLIFDTTVEEEYPEKNNCFGSAALLTERCPKERLYMRFDFTKITDIDVKRIEQVLLCIPVYSNNNAKLQIQTIKEPWCSVGTNWANKVQGG